LDRRQFLLQVGGATAAITLGGTALGFLLEEDNTLVVTAGNVDVEDLLTQGNMPAPGTRPEYTPLGDHYRIDISLEPPVIDEQSWRLNVGGMVEEESEFSLAQLREYDPIHQFITISCISNRVAGDLIGTTRWTGFSMRDLLADINYQEDATHIKISSADGFFEIVEIQEILDDERVMLAYEWDGVPLTTSHGFPLRIYLPDRYGMKQPKWITDFEFIGGWEEGYWVHRGWDRDAIVKTTSVIDTIAVDSAYTEGANLMVPMGGIAYAGAKGISRVEVRIDDGDWQQATLRDPLSDLTWVVWRFDWPFESGSHTITVRAFEGDGTQQIEARASQRPSGATGYHSLAEDFELG
jgi:DMSO/TMAO reductase YedYZ molybdopterin-dependent catalytic subunit